MLKCGKKAEKQSSFQKNHRNVRKKPFLYERERHPTRVHKKVTNLRIIEQEMTLNCHKSII